LGLLSTDPVALGWSLPIVKIRQKNLEISDILGRGGSSDVYLSSYQGRSVAVKCFRAGKTAAFEQELANLACLKKNASGLCGTKVPTVVGVDRKAHTIVLSPVGRPFSAVDTPNVMNPAILTKHHLLELVEILRVVHRDAGMVHRDLSLRNMFDVDGHLMLNDWGCGAMIGQPVYFEGAVTHAPDHILNAVKADVTYIPNPCDDLTMVWRCFVQSRNVRFQNLKGQADPDQIKTFWHSESSKNDIRALAFGLDPYKHLSRHLGNAVPEIQL
jgi:tRNA A-37 threonylcarbamoyl transferase component Bud32